LRSHPPLGDTRGHWRGIITIGDVKYLGIVLWETDVCEKVILKGAQNSDAVIN